MFRPDMTHDTATNPFLAEYGLSAITAAEFEDGAVILSGTYTPPAGATRCKAGKVRTSVASGFGSFKAAKEWTKRRCGACVAGMLTDPRAARRENRMADLVATDAKDIFG